MKTIAPTITESIDTITSGTKIQIDETAKLNDDLVKYSDEQSNKLESITDDLKNEFGGNKNELLKMIESVNNHTKLFAATMKSSKVKIIEQFDKQKAMAVTAFGNIGMTIADGIDKLKSTSSDIVDVVNGVEKNLNDDSQSSLNFKTTITTFVQSFGTSSKLKLDNLRNIVVNFHKKDLKVYSPSGEYH